MNARKDTTGTNRLRQLPAPSKEPQSLRRSFLYFVTEHELGALRQSLERGTLPADFNAKLGRMAQGNLTEGFVARTCHLFVELLLAVQAGSFREVGTAHCERLLRVLAYVRKDDDAIADYKPRGFLDDQEEIRAALAESEPLLRRFKAWRLRQQVPAMWLASQAAGSSARAA